MSNAPDKPGGCKFCGGSDIQTDGQTPATSYIYCQDCGAEMHGTGETRAKQLAFALKRWNTKPAGYVPADQANEALDQSRRAMSAAEASQAIAALEAHEWVSVENAPRWEFGDVMATTKAGDNIRWCDVHNASDGDPVWTTEAGFCLSEDGWTVTHFKPIDLPKGGA